MVEKQKWLFVTIPIAVLITAFVLWNCSISAEEVLHQRTMYYFGCKNATITLGNPFVNGASNAQCHDKNFTFSNEQSLAHIEIDKNSWHERFLLLTITLSVLLTWLYFLYRRM